MLAEILHELIDAAAISPGRRAELHVLADEAETEFLRKAAAIQQELAPMPAKADVPAGA